MSAIPMMKLHCERNRIYPTHIFKTNTSIVAANTFVKHTAAHTHTHTHTSFDSSLLKQKEDRNITTIQCSLCRIYMRLSV